MVFEGSLQNEGACQTWNKVLLNSRDVTEAGGSLESYSDWINLHIGITSTGKLYHGTDN